MRTLIYTLVLSASAFAHNVFQTTYNAPFHAGIDSEKSTILENHYIVKLQTSSNGDLATHQQWLTNAIAFENESSNGDDEVHSTLFEVFDALNAYSGRFTPRLVDLIRQRPEVEYVEQDRMVQWINNAIPSQHSINNSSGKVVVESDASWGLQRIVQREQIKPGSHGETDVDYEYKYSTTTSGEGVTVYVVDTGIKLDHHEFQGRARWGKTFAWFSSDKDGNGHGTHCAGIIGGERFGVAKNVSLVAVKVLSDAGSGAYSWIIAGLNYVIKQHLRKPWWGKAPYRKSVISMSLGGGFSQAINDAVNKAVDEGIFVAVAAGNENADACEGSPASAEKVMTVGASDIADNRAFFSNYGECVNVFAPGLKIISAWKDDVKGYKFLSGTSMATPFVAGVAASLWSGVAENVSVEYLKEKMLRDSTKDVLSNIHSTSPNKLIYNIFI